MNSALERITVVDTHTGGEPTRVVVAGGPDLGSGPLAVRSERFRQEFDHFRTAIVCEPRGSNVLVGALLCEPHEPGCAVGAIFFDNAGVLGMCGHGTLGVTVALGHLGRLAAGDCRFDTPVGTVGVTYDGRHSAAVENVASYRHAAGVRVTLPDVGTIVGDVAWGGNWFFLTNAPPDLPLDSESIPGLTDYATRIRRALHRQGIAGKNGAIIDHIELMGPPANPANHARNFVLCPGLAYDRSPCGTGTSAKIACLVAEGKLAPGEPWRQESVIGSVFTGTYRLDADRILPRIEGSAHVTGETMLLFHPDDPFREGISR